MNISDKEYVQDFLGDRKLYFIPLEMLRSDDSVREDLLNSDPVVVDGYVVLSDEDATYFTLKYNEIEEVSEAITEIVISKCAHLFDNFSKKIKEEYTLQT